MEQRIKKENTHALTQVDPIAETEYNLILQIVQIVQNAQKAPAAMGIQTIGLMYGALLTTREALTVRPSETDGSGKDTLPYVSPRTMEALDELYRIEKDLGIDHPKLRRQIRSACENAGLLGSYSAESPRIGMIIDLIRTEHLEKQPLPDGLTAVKPLYTRTMPIQTAIATVERLHSHMQNEASSE